MRSGPGISTLDMATVNHGSRQRQCGNTAEPGMFISGIFKWCVAQMDKTLHVRRELMHVRRERTDMANAVMEARWTDCGSRKTKRPIADFLRSDIRVEAKLAMSDPVALTKYGL